MVGLFQLPAQTPPLLMAKLWMTELRVDPGAVAVVVFVVQPSNARAICMPTACGMQRGKATQFLALETCYAVQPTHLQHVPATLHAFSF